MTFSTLETFDSADVLSVPPAGRQAPGPAGTFDAEFAQDFAARKQDTQPSV